MRVIWLDAQSADAAAELAHHDRLLDEVDRGAPEALRVWEPRAACVVLGRSNTLQAALDLGECARRRIPVLRRSSGGGAVVLAPGCLVYALALATTGARATAAGAIAEVVQRHAAALSARLGLAVRVGGVSDLALDGRKVSGNAQRRRRHALLIHGTLLFALDPELMAVLAAPPRPPDYRAGRSHSEFVTNLPATAAELKAALRAAWGAR